MQCTIVEPSITAYRDALDWILLQEMYLSLPFPDGLDITLSTGAPDTDLQACADDIRGMLSRIHPLALSIIRAVHPIKIVPLPFVKYPERRNLRVYPFEPFNTVFHSHVEDNAIGLRVQVMLQKGGASGIPRRHALFKDVAGKISTLCLWVSS